MPGRLGPRFAIEALFLIALAAGAAYAELDARWIALIMAAGWLVVALLELTAERIWAAAPPWRRPNYFLAPPEPAAAPEPPLPEPELEPEAATVVAAPVPPEPEPQPEPEPEPQPVAEEPRRPQLEPLQARPKRRWFRRGDGDDEGEPVAPEVPKHVRLLPTTPDRSRASEEVAQIFDAPEREERSRR